MTSHYQEVTVKQFNKVLDRLSDPSMLNLAEFDLYLLAREGANEDFFERVADINDVEIIWTDEKGPQWLAPVLSVFRFSGGLIRIEDPSRLKQLFEELSAVAPTQLFYVRKDLRPRLSKDNLSTTELKDLLTESDEYFYIKAAIDDYVQDQHEYYYVYDCSVGDSTAAVLRTLYTEINS